MKRGPFGSLPLRLAVAASAAFLVGGCAGPGVLRNSYVAYAEAFAGAGNQQLLLNLARVRNVHPPYFLQMGPVTAQYGLTAGFQGSIVDVDDDANLLSSLTRSLGIAVGGSESPVFNFTPLGGAAYGKMLLTPIDANVLYSFASQNVPVSALMRLMVDRVALVYPNGAKTVYHNRYHPGYPENYADFLRLAANLGRLQSGDVLRLETDKDGKISFSLTPEALAALYDFASDNPAYRLSSGVPARGRPQVDIKTRSFMGVLWGAASESETFESLSPEYLESLPEEEREPVLNIDKDPAYTEPPAAEVRYAGKTYVVSDKPGSRRNRANFLVLQLLASQTELDPSQLPVQQLIQVR